MTTLADAQAHQASVANLTTLAIRDLIAFWRTLDLADAATVATELREFMPELLAAYGLAAGAMAADFYDDLRAEAAVALAAYTALTVDAPGGEAAQALVGWGLAPLFQPEVDPDVDLALSRLSAGLQREVAGVDRQTIITNTRNDPAAVRYARHASANACAFCAMLATRQAVYRSDEGEKYHSNCHCVAIPVWPGQEIPEAPYVAEWREAYFRARDDLVGGNEPVTTKAILAAMRENAGLR